MTETSEPKKFKIYKLELIRGSQAQKDDLNALRIIEPAAYISILPVGEKNMGAGIKFTVKDKRFYQMNDDGSLAERGHVDIDAVIRYMIGLPVVAPPLAQSTQVLPKPELEVAAPGVGFNQMKPVDPSKGRILPPARKLGSGPPPKPFGQIISKPETKTDKPAFAIPDKYKIKRKDGEDKT